MFCIYLILKGSDKITSEYKRCQRLVFLLEPEIPTLENYQKVRRISRIYISWEALTGDALITDGFVGNEIHLA